MTLPFASKTALTLEDMELVKALRYSVLGQLPPGLLDDLGQLLQVGGSRIGGDDLL